MSRLILTNNFKLSSRFLTPMVRLNDKAHIYNKGSSHIGTSKTWISLGISHPYLGKIINTGMIK